MPHISELRVGDQLQIWVPQSRALELVSDARGNLSYRAPVRTATPTKPNAFTRFWGLVHENDANRKVIRLHMQPFHGRMQIPTGQVAISELHYTTFSRVRLISPIHYAPNPIDLARPTDHSPLSNTEKEPYRTAVDVRLR